MSVVLEAVFISFTMLFIFGMAFVLLFLFALTLAPIERGLSEYIWSHSEPPKPKVPAPAGSFKDFSKRH
jgi:Na+-transporting methylmalonyl-CoA/oxaloacetate decarboxylase gamma subunit